jgi:hypothetical protein
MGFELTISAGEWPKTYALDRAATGTGVTSVCTSPKWSFAARCLADIVYVFVMPQHVSYL